MALLAEIIKQKRSAANLGSKCRRCLWGVERNGSRQVDAFRSAGHWVGAVSGMESVWHGPTVCYAKPQAQEVAATLRLRPIFIFVAAMQQHQIVDQLYITGLKIYL